MALSNWDRHSFHDTSSGSPPRSTFTRTSDGRTFDANGYEIGAPGMERTGQTQLSFTEETFISRAIDWEPESFNMLEAISPLGEKKTIQHLLKSMKLDLEEKYDDLPF